MFRKNRKIIFFIRRYNDIDHIAPIIYKMASSNEFDIEIFCLNIDLQLKSNYNLKYLRDKFNLRAKYYYFENSKNIRHVIIKIVTKLLLFYKKHFNENSKLVRRYKALFYSELFSVKYFNNEYARFVLDKINPDIIICDWQKPISSVVEFYKECNLRAIPIVTVPHGVNIVVNKLLTFKEISLGFGQDFKSDWIYFDYAITQFQLHKKRIVDGGYNHHKIKVLGSTRYSSEWRGIINKINPESKYCLGHTKSIINVVYMDHRLEFRFDYKIVVESINKLNNLKNIKLVVKPTTGRTHKSNIGLELGVLNHQNSPSIIFEENVSSNVLIEWSDIVISTISSIGIEVLLREKLLIHPQYFHGNDLLYDKMNACWTVKTYNELNNAINKVAIDRSYKPYTQENVNRFLTNVVYGGVNERDVLKDYVGFINEKLDC
jgi:hypothetical protein